MAQKLGTLGKGQSYGTPLMNIKAGKNPAWVKAGAKAGVKASPIKKMSTVQIADRKRTTLSNAADRMFGQMSMTTPMTMKKK